MSPAPISIVVIGRNEGERLRRCLESLQPWREQTIYVDSASTDGSPALARDLGFQALELPTNDRLNAARGRNAGLQAVLERWPEIEAVQFVDGDCEMDAGWPAKGLEALRADPQIGAVFGRLREVAPDASVYNRLCDIEWRSQPGEVLYCGGNTMYRGAAIRLVGGFDDTLIGGEEPELCVRLRAAGWKIMHLADPMARHDAAMLRFAQWWRRGMRTGYGFCQVDLKHADAPPFASAARSTLAWGLILPIVTLAAAWPTSGWSLVLLLAYPLHAWRAGRTARSRGLTRGEARLFGWFCTLAKLPQAIGWLSCRRHAWTGIAPRPIEHKAAPTRANSGAIN